MIIQMQAGIGPEDKRTLTVANVAADMGVKPEIRNISGSNMVVTEVYFLDGGVKACTLPEHPFRQMEGVSLVRRVTPSAVSLSLNGNSAGHTVKIGSAFIGNNLPCQLIAGPCTVDRRIDDLVGQLVNGNGIKLIRGGCWKPRSSAESFPGFGKKGVEWLLKAAKKHRAESVFLEVLDETHITDVQRIQSAVGYNGQIVLWVGARTDNQNLLRKLGRQTSFPVMLKNPIRAKGLAEWMKRVEFVITGERHFDDDGQLIPDKSLNQGNDQILLCSRGVEHDDEESPYRFAPQHEWITAVRKRYWTPVGVDPSHSAGTMVDDLVFRNLEAALVHRPAFAIVEVYFDDRQGLCDAQQAVPLSRICEVQRMIAAHNERHYSN
ncbi:hypothetical protein HYZ76_02665 [Candidatus Falkowbacteria bacterium]|nr:hypothetical protein [Candidatus Falkowbacteria bacterium]